MLGPSLRMRKKLEYPPPSLGSGLVRTPFTKQLGQCNLSNAVEVGNFNVCQCLGLGNVWYECRVRSVVSYILTFNILLCRVYAFSLNRHSDDIYRFKCLWQTLAWPLKYWIRKIHTNRK